MRAGEWSRKTAGPPRERGPRMYGRLEPGRLGPLAGERQLPNLNTRPSEPSMLLGHQVVSAPVSL